ncbi:MAG: ABC transporter [Bacteroidetes bacterium]|nr:MAG: ABC transporter [Bacteroidota bacterium]
MINLQVKLNTNTILHEINLTIADNEQWAVIGASGSGKTTLAHTLAGKHFYTGQIVFHLENSDTADIVVVDQQHRFRNKSNTSDFYYQQRYNSIDSFDTRTVSEELEHYGNQENYQPLAELLHISHVLEEPLIQLSNGENKRLQIAKALLQKTKVLILDNPFIGLDVDGRKLLSTIIDKLSASGTKIILFSSGTEVPDSITNVAIMDQGKIIEVLERDFFSTIGNFLQKNNQSKINPEAFPLLQNQNAGEYKYVIRMVDVNVEYEGRKILQHINWEVKKGDHWAVSGPNGAGKSTLLSLVNGDNPKAYANEIYLFDRRRGTGESIWDIKKKIGYLSPEMHLYFDYGISCFNAVASGLFDSIGMFRPISESQKDQVEQWMSLMNLQGFTNKTLSLLSSGNQRLVLLARALVKNPELLILDEPCQGMDPAQKTQFLELISEICKAFEKTLIYVSHYQDELPDCIDRVLEIKEGIARELRLQPLDL